MQNSEGRDQASEPTGESKWFAMFCIFLLIFILQQVLEAWLPDFLAMGTGVLIVGLALFPIKSIRDRYSFGGWSLRIVLLASCLSLLIFGLQEAGRRTGLFR